MSDKLIIFILLVVYLARPKQPDEIQIRWRNEIRFLLEDALYIRLFIIYVIVSNDDNTIRAVFKHPSKGAQGQVLNSSKGKLENSDRIILLPAFFVFTQPDISPIYVSNYNFFILSFPFLMCRYSVAPKLYLDVFLNYIPNGSGFLNMND